MSEASRLRASKLISPRFLDSTTLMSIVSSSVEAARTYKSVSIFLSIARVDREHVSSKLRRDPRASRGFHLYFTAHGSPACDVAQNFVYTESVVRDYWKRSFQNKRGIVFVDISWMYLYDHFEQKFCTFTFVALRPLEI